MTPWAYAIARRLLLDTFRRHKRKPESSLPDDEFLAPSAGDPERAALSQERIRALGESLKRLPETYRTAFELVRLEGLSMAEAAEILGVTKTAVKLRAHRAYVALGLSDEEPI